MAGAQTGLKLKIVLRAGPGKGPTGRAGPKNIVILPSLLQTTVIGHCVFCCNLLQTVQNCSGKHLATALSRHGIEPGSLIPVEWQILSTEPQQLARDISCFAIFYINLEIGSLQNFSYILNFTCLNSNKCGILFLLIYNHS